MAENKISMEDKAKLGELFATAIEKGELSDADMESFAGGVKISKEQIAKGAKILGGAAAVILGVSVLEHKTQVLDKTGGALIGAGKKVGSKVTGIFKTKA